ncbi:uncharacterized protein LOC111022072 [Momordica charantia]|uniref:Uncharacterized protein LOC111022072 n=1 Tax=Momordica charantia TaxID=3673 RepID=A0A6J1DQ58_MOMCH|nr:uncharacterized protein LOC111022072 [Momordica charantia]
MAEHQIHLQLIFEKLRENELYVKREKCAFAQERINFLDHVIECGRMGMEDGKVKAIQDWKVLSSITELRSFLGLANYYRRFVEGFSKKAGPLTELLKKSNTWNCTPECQVAFNQLKKAMMEGQVLGIADVTKPFEVETDALDFTLSGVLLQDGHLVAYESRKLNDAERRPGRSNKAADALSRKSEHATLCMLAHLKASKLTGSVGEAIKAHLKDDPAAQTIIQLAKDGKTSQFWVEDDLLLTKGNRLYVP